MRRREAGRTRPCVAGLIPSPIVAVALLALPSLLVTWENVGSEILLRLLVSLWCFYDPWSVH
jgi:hypothetical protein